ncbi:hypothetical protein LX77_00463 [Gelidibacter algens]|uniref:Uncharacterized protein n=2 Tax=Gelidibacter algens TaxID=49280 RepID=A0A327SFN5_9FLAO|nr:hypothetical protein LX77_00463 [Gelidibacter algens]
MKINGFRLFPIHIAVKDLSFMIIYFVIMKYNLTNETYLPETISNFPGVPDMSLWNMISVSVFYNLIPMIISLCLYYPIVYGMKNLIVKNKLRLILTGFVLTLTTPILHIILSDWKHNDYYQLSAEFIAWILCFLLSIGFYYVANNRNDKSAELVKSSG